MLKLALFTVLLSASAQAATIDPMACIQGQKIKTILKFFGQEPSANNPAPALSTGTNQSAYFLNESASKTSYNQIVPYQTKKKAGKIIEVRFGLNRSETFTVQYSTDPNVQQFEATFSDLFNSISYTCNRIIKGTPRPGVSGSNGFTAQ